MEQYGSRITRILMKVKKVLEIEVPGLGSRIQQAREADSRSLAEICRQVGMTTMNWYRIEAEENKALPIETLRRIEEVLGVNFGIRLD
ncbi:XRE family transcriptional regulator [Calothrix parasitica NIES-267]|uniref:XRE family transcriptional regulator n=1 Tax=Calothrix parasitica NIES-267 TaxID=1973488 RepID=A0A1Z4LVR2_9CYAN|nr:XRE family transcriptional regulator [Calothrix parasitica NIES-267]